MTDDIPQPGPEDALFLEAVAAVAVPPTPVPEAAGLPEDVFTDDIGAFEEDPPAQGGQIVPPPIEE